MLWRHEDPESDVELALADEEGPLDILLQDEDIRFDISRIHCRLLLVRITRGLVRVCRITGCCCAILVVVLHLSVVHAWAPATVQVVRLREVLELLCLGSGRVLEYQPLQLVDCVEEVDSAAAVGVRRLEEPHVVSIIECWAHRDCGRLALLLAQLVVLYNVGVHLTQNLFLCALVLCIQILILELLYHVEVICELVKLMLAKWRPQVYHEGDWDLVEYVLMQVFAELGHGLDELVFRGDQRMVFEVIHQVFLPMLPKEVELNLTRRGCPLEVVERL